MPWIDAERCTGCATCLETCPVEAIAMDDATASIDDERCIRCGRCHDVCPQEAVRHDAERIPFEVERNMAWVDRLAAHYTTPAEASAFRERMRRHFAKEKQIAEQTLQRLGFADGRAADQG